ATLAKLKRFHLLSKSVQAENKTLSLSSFPTGACSSRLQLHHKCHLLRSFELFAPRPTHHKMPLLDLVLGSYDALLGAVGLVLALLASVAPSVGFPCFSNATTSSYILLFYLLALIVATESFKMSALLTALTIVANTTVQLVSLALVYIFGIDLQQPWSGPVATTGTYIVQSSGHVVQVATPTEASKDAVLEVLGQIHKDREHELKTAFQSWFLLP
ncbi:hypothetical protein GQ53DRAFT_885408, partial [Thozetella sp. PMI_491]